MKGKLAIDKLDGCQLQVNDSIDALNKNITVNRLSDVSNGPAGRPNCSLGI